MIKIDIFKKIGGRYGSVELKVNTAFRLHAVTQISGPSGIGKTTLLKILAGLILPDAGTVTVKNDIWFDTEKKFSKKVQDRNVGFVFQDYALFPNMTVEEHLQYEQMTHNILTFYWNLEKCVALAKGFPNNYQAGNNNVLLSFGRFPQNQNCYC